MRFRRATQLLLCFALATSILSGCGGAPAGSRTKEVSHAKALAVLYMSVCSSLQRNPASADEFKQEIASLKPDLSVLGVGSIEELFVSDRDGKPLVILYGAAPAGATQGVVVYEQEGVNGVRLVGSANGQVGEANSAEFAKLVPKPIAP